MYVIEVIFQIIQKQNRKEQADLIYSLCGSWRMNGQMLNRHFPLVENSNNFIVYVNTPESDSLSSKYNNTYVSKEHKKLVQVGLKYPTIIIKGKEPQALKICDCDNKSYILYTNYLTLEAPLRCGDCFGIVPLYKIPKTYDDEYYNVISWQSDYQACDSLQMNCKVGDRWATNQLSKPDSALSRQGLDVCKKIESITGKKVYYYLYRDRGKSLKEEKKRKCPSCDAIWYEKEQRHNLFDFVCERCHLLSNIAWDL